MEIKEFFGLNSEEQSYWLSKINEADWAAGKYLFSLLSENKFFALCGEKSKVFLLTDKKDLISFCTYAQADDIPNTELTPWIGFVFTFPAFRGKRRIEKLIEHICTLAKADGFDLIYISTDQKGLYEHFGFSFFTTMKDMRGDTSFVYKRNFSL